MNDPENCRECGSPKLFTRGFCNACYRKLRKGGIISRINAVSGGYCKVEGCSNLSFARGLCQPHYHKAAHPLKSQWRNLRTRSPDLYPPEWDYFDIFLAVVGERPSPRAQLRRKDPFLPWSNDNFHWLEPLPSKFMDCYTPEERAEYSREWTIRKKFGITGAQYDLMLQEQNGVCAICEKPETHAYKSGRPRTLAVDHSHTDGKVRALLCFACNSAIGLFKEDVDALRTAAAYLEKHSARNEPMLSCAAIAAE